MRSKIEAILFATGEPIDVGSLAKFLSVSKKEINKSIEALESFYYENKSGLQIIKKGSKIQLASSEKQGDLVAKFLNKKLHEPLSKAALEVLSVVVYRGPITRAQIEHIRGVNCSFTLRNLAVKGLIDRKDNPADNRSYIYEASFDFLKSMGFSEIKNLPNYEELHEQELFKETESNGQDRQKENNNKK